MKKRIVALLFSALIVLGCFNISLKAESDTDTASDVGVTSSNGYSSYISAFVDAEPASEEIYADFNQDSKLYSFNVTESALYAVKVLYTTTEDGQGDIEVKLELDGAVPFDEASMLKLKRFYRDNGDKRSDSYGNEISPEQVQVTGDYESKLTLSNNCENVLLYLESGVHTVNLLSDAENFMFRGLVLTVPQSIPSYKNYIAEHGTTSKYDGAPVEIEGEQASVKTQNNLISLSDSSSADVYPYDAAVSKLNYIGGKNWNNPGEAITWNVEIEKEGLYKLGVNYRQNYTLNTVFYREIKIDGEVPFAEASAVPFEYARNWEYKVLADNDNQPYFFYLKPGKHTLTLTVTQGPATGAIDKLEVLSYELASFYRSMIMITGDSPDLNRDYNLFDQIPDFIKKLEGFSLSLDEISKDISAVNGTDGAYAVSTVNNMKNVIENMLSNKYSAHRHISRYYSCYASLNAMALEMSSMPLDIDMVSFGSGDTTRKVGFIKKFLFFIKRFIVAFYDDYAATTSNFDFKEREEIEIWVNWGRDQVKVLQYLTQSDFSAKHNIDVNIRLTNATLLQAILSGSGPDCALHVSRSEPVNLAMRCGAYDLTNFSDYEQVLYNFMEGADQPYWYEKQGKRGLYALPDMQSFYMLFVRTDIFKEFGLQIPTTWEEFNHVSDVLARKNMQVGLPYTQIIEMTQVNTGAGALSIFPTLLLQKGGSLYNKDLTGTDLLSDTAMQTFETWVDYYKKRSFPLTYDFFNRFRLGLIPMAIQNYTMYATITGAASELDGSWGMFPIPATVNEDGTVSEMVTGGGTGCLILEQSKNKKASWEYLKWWVSEDVQYRYCADIETQLGSSARVATSNVKALCRLEWGEEDLSNLVKQWERVNELPEVPGGYYVSRVLDQAFWNSVNAGENAKDCLLEWAEIAETEIDRKRKQYQ